MKVKEIIKSSYKSIDRSKVYGLKDYSKQEDT